MPPRAMERAGGAEPPHLAWHHGRRDRRRTTATPLVTRIVAQASARSTTASCSGSSPSPAVRSRSCCENIFAPLLPRPGSAAEIDALARIAREYLELVIRGLQSMQPRL